MRANVISLVVLFGIVVVPSFYAWFNIAGSWDPYGNTKNLAVAVASSDKGYASDLLPVRLNLGKRVAAEERSKGAAQAERIRASADRQSEVILAEAYRDAQKTKGEGDAEASRIYAEAFGKDPEFARFYRNLEAYRQSFSEKTDVLVMDPSSDFLGYMKDIKR